MRLVFIDTPPAVTTTIRNVVAHADLVLIPARPSPHDLRAIAATLDIVEYRDKPFVFVVNGATPRARITADAAIALSQHGTVAPVTIHHRNDFASSMIDGRTVGECDANGKSAQEISQLWSYLATRLAKLEPRPVLMPMMPERPVFGRQEPTHTEPVTAAAVPVEAAPAPAGADVDEEIYGSLLDPREPSAPVPRHVEVMPDRPADRPAFGRRDGAAPASGFGRRGVPTSH